ncbi:RNA-directed DNA polymerase [Maioricimonas sp. JC845]|uniref:RNA-directed DNA polymerase n=1 Tax=Maioricimonas sp. JC845 TaxID=3232138 RepID=UPI0034580974
MAGESARAYRNSDSLRGLIHDTAPDELPLFVSNFGTHANLVRLGLDSFVRAEELSNQRVHSNPHEWIGSLVGRLLCGGKYEIPMGIDAVTSEGKRRSVSLPHIRSQWRFAEFLHRNSNKLLYYCSVSPCSLRAPNGIARDAVQLAGTTTVRECRGLRGAAEAEGGQAPDIGEGQALWPKRMFSYRGVKRLHRFFDSQEFISLEEEFPLLELLDVQSAFESIYTHALSWATRGKVHAKTYASRDRRSLRGQWEHAFGDECDRVMQMANWNETNGILVGPETSRIVAEVLFQRVDVEVLAVVDQRLGCTGPDNRPYAVYRYVDDYFVFARKSIDLDIVRESIAKVLARYRLRLNQAKTRRLERPFVTEHGGLSHELSKIIDAAGEQFERLGELGCEAGASVGATERVKAVGRWRRTLVSEIRAACKRHDAGVALAVSRVPGALRSDAFRLLKRMEGRSAEHSAWAAERGVALLDVCAYLLSIKPTEACAVAFSTVLLVCLKLLRQAGGMPSCYRQYERLFERCMEVATRLALNENGVGGPGERPRGQVALCNVLGAMAEFPSPWTLTVDEVYGILGLGDARFDGGQYLELMTVLFYAHRAEGTVGGQTVEGYVAQVEDAVEEVGLSHAGVANAVLDILGCPAVSRRVRRSLLKALASGCDMSKDFIRTGANQDRVLGEWERHPWFVDWRSEVPLLAQARRRAVTRLY